MARYRLPERVDVDSFFDLDELCEPGIIEFDRDAIAAAKALLPNKPQRISEWAQSGCVRLPTATSTRAGKIQLYPYQPGILDAQQEPGADIIALMGVPRIGKTTLHMIGVTYYSAHEGDDVLFIERSKDAVQEFHDSVLYPVMNASSAFDDQLRDADNDNGDPKDKWFNRQLKSGAFVRLRSAESPGSFRQIRARRAYLSEVGDPAWAAGPEGDKIDAALKRVQNYPDGCAFLESSPTDEEVCVITAYWKKSDQRKFMCACPHCGVVQELVPRVGEKEGPGLKYAIDADNGRVIDAWFECQAGCRIEETQKLELFKTGEWEATRAPDSPGIIGFHLWAIHSFDKRSSWMKIAEKHLEQLHDPAKRQTFKNLWLGLPWQKADMGAITVGEMEARAEAYADEVPDGVVVLTLGGDNQKGTQLDVDAGGKAQRHEVQIVGWGYGEESWVIDHVIVEGDLYSPDAKAKLLELMTREYRKRDGTRMKILGGCIDANYLMNETLDFVYSPDVQRMRHMHMGQNLFAVVGKNEAKGSRTKFATLKRTASHKSMIYYPLATQAAKDTLERRKKIMAGPEAIHWPQSLLETKDGPYDWFKSFSAIVRKRTKDGRTYWEDKPGNEAVDCWIYAYGALQLLKEKYGDIRQALAKPTEMPEPYEGRDRSHRAQLAEGGVQTVDTRPGAAAKPRLVDRRSAVSVTVTDKTPAADRTTARSVDASPRAPAAIPVGAKRIGTKTLRISTRRIG